MTSSIANTTARAVGWCPTMYINDQFFCAYNDKCGYVIKQLTSKIADIFNSASSYDDFKRKVCESVTGPKPAACN